ncbi:PQQ-binding-like beta-propeller repeat protein [Micromonospora sp. NPDC049301]|uniref:outer membrane protein assembly factor BamB family protein n=1 Tax=Micromonospora sp. NPDC049301 TaxID=3155723 RepID=UPI00341654B9
MTGPVIDLGELRHEPERSTLPRPPRANGRPLRCALVLLLALVTLASAALPTRRSVVTLPGRLGTEAQVAGDLFLVIDPPGPQGGQLRLTAFRLPDGEPAWQVPLPAGGRFWGIYQHGGILLVTGHQATADGESALTVALDRATGAYRWQQPGNATGLADGNLLLQSGDGDEAGLLRAVDPCCGTVRWQLPITPGAVNSRDTGHGLDRLVFSHPNGSTEVRDATTGTVLARTDLHRVGRGASATVQVVDDLLLTVGGAPSTVTAYGLDRLDQRWRTSAGEALYALDCAPVICLQTWSGGVHVVDRATGQPLWHSDRWGWVWPYAGRLVATKVSSAGPGAEELVVLDPPTGRVLAELGRWELAQFGLGGPMIGLRRHPDGGLLVAELDVRAGTARMLDVLPEASGECHAVTAGQLLCRRTDASYGLWRLPA